jgi:capsular exopolysaccharide synthesis family protein
MRSSSQRPVYQDTYSETPLDSGEDENSLRHVWLMILEKKWYAVTVFLLCIIVAVTYTVMQTRIYLSGATVQVLRRSQQVLTRVQDVVDNNIVGVEDLNTQMKILESIALLQSVANRMTPEETQRLTAPFKNGSDESMSPVTILFKGRKIIPQRASLMVAIQFRHPDRTIAARVANLIAEEYIGYNSRLRVEESMRAVDDLKDRADQQRKRVDEIANSLQSFRQRGNMISLVQSKDIVTEKLRSLSALATDRATRLREAEIKWNQVQAWRKEKRDLTELPFISVNAKVGQLISYITSQKNAVAQLRDRYREKHPRLIEAANALAQSERELQLGLETATASIKAEYENAVRADEEARKALADQETKSFELDHAAVEYENLMREFRVNDQLLESMMARMRETAVSSTIETQSARIIDRAFEPIEPITPKIPLNIALGLIGGLVLGIGFSYTLAMLDDRVKNAFDVETLVGLPLVGMIPRVGRLDQEDKAQLVSNGAEPVVSEAFLSLRSTLRLQEQSKNAKCIMVTSTMPGEGKSFVSTNLALAFASQGERTVIVDADLRKPNVQRSFRLPASKGVISYCLHNASLDEIANKQVYPNLDVITTGGRAKNPGLLFNSKEFESLVAELSSRYDRVIFDTPPLGAVSDALSVLPLMDGSVFTIQFNRVNRRAARRSVRRLSDASIPIFGAVLNDTNAGTLGEYYGEYGDKTYKEYYELKIESPVTTRN